MRLSDCVALIAFTVGLAACNSSSQSLNQPTLAQMMETSTVAAADPSNTVILEIRTGKVTIKLRPDLAPKHVERVKTLVREGFYNGLKWHRVIAGFMAQTGDPLGTGQGGSNYPDLPAEFTPTAFERGTVGAARSQSPNSANSQFFICFTHTPDLNGKYTVWGQVTEGMHFVDGLAKGEPPEQPDVIIRMYLASEPPKG